MNEQSPPNWLLETSVTARYLHMHSIPFQVVWNKSGKGVVSRKAKGGKESQRWQEPNTPFSRSGGRHGHEQSGHILGDEQRQQPPAGHHAHAGGERRVVCRT